MNALAGMLKTRVGRDRCGDSCISGKHGNIHEDGKGYCVAVLLDEGHAWHGAKRKLCKFMELRQDGDTEGVFHLPKLPTRKQATLLKRVLGLKTWLKDRSDFAKVPTFP